MNKLFTNKEALSFGWHTFKSNWKFWIVLWLLFSVTSFGGYNYSSKGNNYLEDSKLRSLNKNDNLFALNNSKTVLGLNSVNNEITKESTNTYTVENIEKVDLSPKETWEPSKGIVIGLVSVGAIIAISIFIVLIMMSLVRTIFQMGYLNVCIDAARSKEVYYKTLLNQVSFNKALRFLIASLLSAIIVVFGLMFFVIPGIIFALKYMFVPFVIVDKDLKPMDALKKSSEITKGYRMQLLGLSILELLVMILGVFALGVGVIISGIVVLLATSYAYVKLSDKELIIETDNNKIDNNVNNNANKSDETIDLLNNSINSNNVNTDTNNIPNTVEETKTIEPNLLA